MGIPYMTRKSKQNAKKQPKKPTPKKKTPFADTGEIVGNRLASMFNMPVLKGIGRWLGQGVGHVFGSGDYTVVGSESKYNILSNSGQIPKFSGTDKTNIICHREFIATINSTTSFVNHALALNPGDPTTFPWLSNIAAGFQEYKFHGIIFEFKALTTDYAMSGQPGVLVMATNYNAAEPAFASKIEMETTEFAVSTKPTLNLLHPIECDPSLTPFPKSYIRTGAIPSGQDPRLYDLGVTQIAVQGSSSSGVVLGEIWASYCVEFFKPKLSADIGGITRSWSSARAACTGVNPLGTVQVYVAGDLPVECDAHNIKFPSKPGQEYLLSYYVYGDTAGILVHPIVAYNNCEVIGTDVWTPEDTTSTRRASCMVKIRATTVDLVNRAEVTFGVLGTLPTVNTGCYLTLTEISNQSQ